MLSGKAALPFPRERKTGQAGQTAYRRRYYILPFYKEPQVLIMYFI